MAELTSPLEALRDARTVLANVPVLGSATSAIEDASNRIAVAQGYIDWAIARLDPKAIGKRLAASPPRGFRDSYSEVGWTEIAKAVLNNKES